MGKSIIVKAEWDEDAKVWVATSTDVEGLCTEAETIEELNKKIKVMLAELIELNGICSEFSEIPVHLFAESNFSVSNLKN